MNNQEKGSQPAPLKGVIAVALVKFIYWLPRSFTSRLSQFINKLAFQLSSKKRNIILTNLNIAFPHLDQKQQIELAKKSTKHAGSLLPEFLIAWFGDRQQIENEISQTYNREIVDQLIDKGKPVIVVTPHIGNWEFLGQWVQIYFPMIALYTASKIPQMDQLILNARSKFGGQHYSTDNKGILNLLRSLKKGRLMLILPDQVPKQGAGIFSSFFGKPAYTMTLVNKFIQKTNAQLVFAYCVRRANNQGFEIKFELPEFDSFEVDPAIFNQGMNNQIETIIKQYPEQYVWDYKRFKQQPDGKSLYS